MFLLIGALVAVDVLFLVVVTAIDQSRLRVVIKETIPTVCCFIVSCVYVPLLPIMI